jgi:hypothetical protein
MYTNMWGYIIGGFIISYYLTFCGALAYVSCKEYQEERRQRMIEYEELPRQNPGIEMFLESEYENRRGQRLEPIREGVEEKVFDIV